MSFLRLYHYQYSDQHINLPKTIKFISSIFNYIRILTTSFKFHCEILKHSCPLYLKLLMLTILSSKICITISYSMFFIQLLVQELLKSLDLISSSIDTNHMVDCSMQSFSLKQYFIRLESCSSGRVRKGGRRHFSILLTYRVPKVIRLVSDDTF